MDYYCSRTEILPATTRALEELRSIQKIRLKTKMTSKTNIGDGVATMVSANISKKYTGTITINIIDRQIAISSDGRTKMVLSYDQIQSCSIVNNIVTLQLREDDFWEKCVLGFHSEEQVQMFKPKLSPIKRPEDNHNFTEESDTDFDDSGNEKTSGINNNSFNSDEPSEQE